MMPQKIQLINSFDATSCDHLKRHLAAAHANLPPRHQRNKERDTERWLAHRLLRYLADTHELHFPLKVHFRDRPDMRLEWMGSEQIGVEITESIPQALAQFSNNERGTTNPTHIACFSEISRDSRLHILKAERVILRACERLCGQPFYGLEPETLATHGVAKSINKKLADLRKNEFEKLPLNWLLVWSNNFGLPTNNWNCIDAFS